MLSGETAVGKYPGLAVEHMYRIATYTERHVASMPTKAQPPARLREARDNTAALAHGIWTMAQDINARIIVVWSQSGRTARILSQTRFHIPIVAATTSERAARQMQVMRGVTPVCMKLPQSHAQFTQLADELLIENRLANRGDASLIVAGWPLGEEGTTNRVEIHVVGDHRNVKSPLSEASATLQKPARRVTV
jgi:pyruvate kinase